MLVVFGQRLFGCYSQSSIHNGLYGSARDIERASSRCAAPPGPVDQCATSSNLVSRLEAAEQGRINIGRGRVSTCDSGTVGGVGASSKWRGNRYIATNRRRNHADRGRSRNTSNVGQVGRRPTSTPSRAARKVVLPSGRTSACLPRGMFCICRYFHVESSWNRHVIVVHVVPGAV